jgi:hypothetical protein
MRYYLDYNPVKLMPVLPRVFKLVLGCGLAVAGAFRVQAQSDYVAEGGEYAIAGTLAGDQTYPQLSLKPSGGYVVWQDNITDGSGLGVSARKLNSSLSGTLSPFRVNETGAGDQEHPQVSLLKDGGAVFVWQGGTQGFQRIYARFLSAGGTWTTGDVLVNTFTNSSQLEPAVATLTNGDVVAVWASFNQVSATSLRDVFAQRLSAAGQKLGVEFLVNQSYNNYNQRSPAIAALKDGRLVVAWVSEHQRFENSVDVYARIYGADGTPAGGEFLVNTATNVCANPSVAASADGGFAVAWMEKDLTESGNSWDVFVRPFSGVGTGGAIHRVNTQVHGDQLAPKISAAGADYLVVWTSMAQDGSREGIYGRFLQGNGSASGNEFRLNTTTVSQQVLPAVASDGNTRFLAVWTSFIGGTGSFDLYAQRYATVAQPLSAPDAPFVTVLSSNALGVTWPVLAGYSVASYEVYADGTASATAVVTNNWWTMSGLAPGSTHSFRLAYVLTDGRRSPLSGVTTNTTYGALAYGGIPYEWMIAWFGNDIFNWPSPFADSDGDGVSNRDEFLAGTNPTNASSVLKQQLRMTPQGLFLSWNTQPGLVYQVQNSANLGAWTNVSGPRFAAGTADSIYVGGGNTGYYRIVRLR